MFLVWMLGCAAEEPGDAVFQLVRASMALRGTRPALAELRAVAADPAALDTVVDGYVAGADFGATIRDLHADALLLRAESRSLPAGGALDGTDTLVLSRALMEEPLRLVEWVVLNGRPYSEIVTTDVVVADETVAAVWGLARDAAAEGPVPTTWGDGRPAAGILVSSGLWRRHVSNGDNQNRARANRITRALVCQDFLTADVPLDELAFADAREAADAVRTVPACTGCHATLDPIASFFYGFAGTPTAGEVRDACDTGDCYPIASWRPERAGEWAEIGMPAPAWFGAPGDDLADLGRLIAADPRFPTCAARRFAGWMRHVDPDAVPGDEVEALADAFVGAGEDARVLARAAVATDAFREAPPLPIRPEQLSRMLADLTGWAWTDAAGVDLLTSDLEGWRALAGGIDSVYVTLPDEGHSPTKALVLARAAEAAAAHVVAADLAEPARARLLTRPEDLDGQLADLHLRILGEVADHATIGETRTLFEGVRARGGDDAAAWTVVIAAMLQDGRVAWY